MTYRVEIAPAAGRDLKHLDKSVVSRLEPAILSLGEDPRPPGTRKIRDSENSYRIRVGEYRIIYDVYDNQKLVVVLRVERRSENTYRRIP